MYMLGELSFFLGLQVHQTKNGIFISQIKYLKKILKKFGMESCASVNRPMVVGYKLNKDNESLEVDQIMYRYTIGKFTLSHNLKTKHYASSHISKQISIKSKGNSCECSKQDI